MSLELGRSSAARDDGDDSESAEVTDATAESGAQQPPDEGTADSAPRRSVLAPFMTAGGADDSLAEGASDDLDDDSDDLDDDLDDDPDDLDEVDEVDEVAGDVVSGTGEDDAPEGVAAFSPGSPGSPGAPEEGTTADADVVLIDLTSPATGGDDSVADVEEGPAAAAPDDAEAGVATDEEDTITPRTDDAETAAAAEPDDLADLGVPRQGSAGDRDTFGASAAGSPLADAASPATAASSVPAPRTGAAEPRLDSGGLGKMGADVDEPLLEDAEALRTNWLRLQAGFVDDPHEAVSDAADLVEHTAQALVGALRMRQQELREMWDGGRPKDSGTAGADADSQGAQTAAADTTEQLRLLMKRYRVLFNHICRS
jgi:hypothetical protein